MKEAVVSARVHSVTKEKLAATGYNAADAIEWFVKKYYKDDIQEDLLRIQLEKLEKEECEIQEKKKCIIAKLGVLKDDE